MPSLLSVTEPSVPWSVASTTVAPPLVRLLPLTSFAWTVIVEVAPAASDAGAPEMTDWPAFGTLPAEKPTVTVLATAPPPSVASTCAVPALVEVSVAVYVPFPLSVTDESVPRSVWNTTGAPPLMRLLSLLSFA